MSRQYTLASATNVPPGSTRQTPLVSVGAVPCHPPFPLQAEKSAPAEPPWQEAAAACIEAKDWSRCYALALDASGRYSARALSVDLAQAQVFLGRCFAAAGDDERAEARFNAGLQMARLLGDADVQLDALKRVVDLQVRQQKYSTVEHHIEAALQVMAGEGQRSQRADVFICLARALVSHATVLTGQGKVAAAAMQCRRAVDLQLSVWNDTLRSYGAACENLARAHLMLGNMRLSTCYGLALLRVGRMRADLRMQALACECIARTRSARHQPDSAIRWLARARRCWQPVGDTFEHAASLAALSQVLAAAGESHEATGLLRQSQAIERRLEASKTALRIALKSIDTAVERQARMEAETLSHSNRLTILGSMVASISHEVLQPLSAIRLLAEDALDLARPEDGASAAPPEPAHRSLARIVELVDRMTTHVEHLKRFARREKPAIGSLSVANLVRDALTIVEPKRKACAATLTLNVEELFATGDMASATAIVVNLLSNALDAVAEAGTTVVSLSCKQVGAQVWLEVRDQGPGLSPESLPQLFRPWFTTKALDKGLGLGLALSREIAEKMGGHLEGGNHPEGGAIFRLSLPRTPAFSLLCEP